MKNNIRNSLRGGKRFKKRSTRKSNKKRSNKRRSNKRRSNKRRSKSYGGGPTITFRKNQIIEPKKHISKKRRNKNNDISFPNIKLDPSIMYEPGGVNDIYNNLSKEVADMNQLEYYPKKPDIPDIDLTGVDLPTF
jgi:hypothetical protein